jgi:hypothetical protein
MIPYYFKRQSVEGLLFLLIFVRPAWIPRFPREGTYLFPEFLKPFVDGSVQLLSQFAQFAGVLGGKELMD